MKKLRQVIETAERLHMLSDAKVVIDNADSNDKLKLIVQPSTSNGSSRLNDVLSYLDSKYDNSDYKVLDKGSISSPLQVQTDKYVLKNLMSTSILDNLVFSVSVIK